MALAQGLLEGNELDFPDSASAESIVARTIKDPIHAMGGYLSMMLKWREKLTVYSSDYAKARVIYRYVGCSPRF